MKNRLIAALLALAFGMSAHAAPPAYTCWDGSVVKNPKRCPVFRLPVVCPDGKVVDDVSECYTDPPVCPDAGCPWPPPPEL